MGWGGVGMMTFLALAHMVGATQHHVPCTCTHGRCYASNGMGWGGVGMITFLWTFPDMFVDVFVSRNLYVYKNIYVQSMASFFRRFNIDDNQITETAKNQHKRLDCQTLQFFSCSNSLRLPVHWDTTSKNTVAHSTFEHLDHHYISKIVILPHKSHVSHKYKCMNDGFWINQCADQKKSSAQNTILCREWLLQKLTFHHNEITIF